MEEGGQLIKGIASLSLKFSIYELLEILFEECENRNKGKLYCISKN